MTERPHDDLSHDDLLPMSTPDGDAHDLPLDPWMLSLVRDVADEVEVPREMMWKRIEQRRAAAHVRSAPHRAATIVPWRRVAAIAAVLVGGIAIGRYSVSGPPASARTAGTSTASANDVSAAPARVAMQEHLVRTVALLTTVRDRDPALGPEPDVSSWARELLGTTRLLLDEPSLRDDRTRRLLQDLELVLMQILQSRGTTAPEAQRAPTETMRETNLLPRVRAVVTASAHREEQTVHGDDE